MSPVAPLRSLPGHINKKIGKAMHDYDMLQHDDRVLVAVSGGVDSSFLAWLLPVWRAKAPIDYFLRAVYIDNGYWQATAEQQPPAERIARLMARCGIELTVLRGREMAEEERSCYLCARNRRSQLFDLAKEWKMNKIAMGHHLDDLVETLYINMLYSGNISTMVPRQPLFEGEVHIIRPLAYVEKEDIRRLARRIGLEAVKNDCPLEKETRRETVRALLAEVYRREPGAKRSLLQAMKNVRGDYLL